MTRKNAYGLPVNIPGSKAPVRIWSPLDEVEETAQDQIRNASKLPWTHGVAVMPDVHTGYGVTIGTVLALDGAISPSAVGVDIGCGMTAVKTSLTVNDLPDDLKPIRNQIERDVPVGRAAHRQLARPLETILQPQFDKLFSRFGDLRADVDDRLGRAIDQCGTLGGGNHFIEMCSDTEGGIWLTLHSGSRNIGKTLADLHINKAKTLEWNSDLPDRDLAVFLHRDDEGNVFQEWTDYLHDLYWAQEYALLNRKTMMALVKAAVARFFKDITFEPEIACHHNYVAQETYGGLDLVITRKGAISAKKGELGVIPGSMGTGSYIVRGLGNEDSYCSASHGAGRKMSRAQARKTFTTADLRDQTSGVECRKDSGVLDEAPGAYKDLDQVIAYQSDLVEVVTKLDTLLCVKG